MLKIAIFKYLNENRGLSRIKESVKWQEQMPVKKFADNRKKCV